MKRIMMLLIVSVFISQAYAYLVTDLQWGQGVSGKLHRGDEIKYDEYTVKAIGFSDAVESDRYRQAPAEPVDPFVGLNISKNGSFMNTTALRPGESFITPDGELRVTATSLPSKNATEWLLESYHPWGVIELSPRGKPNLEISVETDKDEYSSSDDKEIIASVTLKNTGSADAFDVDMEIETQLSVKSGDLKYHYVKLKKSESTTETITFVLPITTEDNTYSIRANVSGYDVKDLPYTAASFKNITIAIDPEWSMSLRKTTLEKIYLTDSAMISLALKNNGKIDIKNVSISDSLPKGFKLVSNTSLHWVSDVPAGEEWNYRYIVTPEEPNAKGVVFPVATAEFKVKKELYGIRSNQPKILVYGPMVTINKHTDVNTIIPGSKVTVTVTAKNTGSTPSRIFIKDQLPADATLINGITSYEEFLEAGKEVSFSYTLEINSEGTIKLPPATAQYYKLGNKGGKISAESNGVEIKIKSPSQINPVVATPQKTPPPVITPAPTPTIEPAKPPNSGIVKDDKKNKPRLGQVKIDTFLSFILGCNNANAGNRFIPANGSCNYFKKNTP